MSIGERVKFKLVRLFFSESILGGLTVILPLAIIAFFFSWLLEIVTLWINPIGHLFDEYDLPIFLSDVFVIGLIITACAIVGRLVRTRMGGWIYHRVETGFLRELPGYGLLKDIVEMLLAKKSSPFKGEVAQVWLYGRSVPTWTIALITSRHADGSYTAFVPTAPSPASGVVYHLGADQVEIHPDISIDQAFKVIVACGAGSSKLFEKLVAPPTE